MRIFGDYRMRFRLLGLHSLTRSLTARRREEVNGGRIEETGTAGTWAQMITSQQNGVHQAQPQHSKKSLPCAAKGALNSSVMRLYVLSARFLCTMKGTVTTATIHFQSGWSGCEPTPTQRPDARQIECEIFGCGIYEREYAQSHHNVWAPILEILTAFFPAVSFEQLGSRMLPTNYIPYW